MSEGHLLKANGECAEDRSMFPDCTSPQDPSR
jgi:hypothetical protein